MAISKKAVYAARIITIGSTTEFRKEFWKDVIYELRENGYTETIR